MDMKYHEESNYSSGSGPEERRYSRRCFFFTKIDWVGATASIDSTVGAVQICQRRTGGVSESDTFVLFPGKMTGGRNG
jgi:hypothetical protein